MTLARYVICLMLLFIFVIQIGGMSLFIWHNKVSLQAQNQQRAQDTAQLIAYQFSTSLKDKLATDKKLPQINQLRGLINPLLKSGHFDSITLVKDQQSVLYHVQFPLKVRSIPQWFLQGFGYEKKPQEILFIEQGHEYKISIEMSIQRANLTLYNTIKTALGWLICVTLLACFALSSIIRKLLQPLNQLQGYAHAISHHQFDGPIPLPKTRELRKLTQVMNRMGQQLQRVHKQQLNLIKTTRTQAFVDSLTGLANATAFEQWIYNSLHNSESNATDCQFGGIIILAKAQGIEIINHRQGRSLADANIIQISRIWHSLKDCNNTQMTASDFNNPCLARRAGAEFLAWLPINSISHNNSISLNAVQAISSYLHQAFKHQQNSGELAAELSLHLAVYSCGLVEENQWQAIMQTLDQQLNYAIEHNIESIDANNPAGAGALASHLNHKSDLQDPLQIAAWSQFFPQILAEKKLHLVYQPITHPDGLHTLWCECFLRIPYQDEVLTGTRIWPWLEKLQLTYAFDRLVIQEVCSQLANNVAQSLSINLNNSTLSHQNFIGWFTQILERYTQRAAPTQPLHSNNCIGNRLIIEVNESFLQHTASLEILIILKQLGVRIFLDQVTASTNTMDQLMQLPIDGIKLNVTFIRQICQNNNQAIFIQSLLMLAKTCGLQIILEGVENGNDWGLAIEAELDGVQGFGICTPLDSLAACYQQHCIQDIQA